MPKTPVQIETSKSNPFITKSISKSLLTPCRQVGLSRKRKTPNSANRSFSESSTVNTSLSSILETTPVSSNSVLAEAQNESVISKVENAKLKKKTRVSKRLITEDESSEKSNVENANKKPCLVNSRTEETVLQTKHIDVDEDVEVASTKKVTDSPKVHDVIQNANEIKLKSIEKSKKVVNVAEDEEDEYHERNSTKGIKLRKSPRKSKKGNISTDNEDTYYDSNKSNQGFVNINDGVDDLKSFEKDSTIVNERKHKEKACVEELGSKSKKGESKNKKSKLSPKNRKKIAIILSDDDDDDFSPSNRDNHESTQEVESKDKLQANNKKNSLSNSSNCKVNEDVANPQTSKVQLTKEINKAAPSTNPQKVDDNKSIILKDVTNEKESNSPHTSDHDYYMQPKSKTKKIKRSLSMKKSNNEDYDQHEDLVLKDCLITLTPLDISNLVKDNTLSTDDMQNLEKQIKEKRKLLEDLKQADIYQKKHNVKELQELTAHWKTGCISALNDLLPQLQTHVSIDMATLLKNLNIPPEMVTLSQDGNLI